jgi:tetratricopeptide (TPR) repeat protein
LGIVSLPQATLNNVTASKQLQYPVFHDGVYFQKLGERLQFYQHDPSTVDECFRTALWKAPANSRTFLLYARYLSTRTCCIDRVEPLIKESIRRSPSTMEDYPAAIKLLADTGHKTEGLKYLKKYVEAGAIVPFSLFASFSTDDLLRIMPRKPEPLFHYCFYLNGLGESHKQDVHKVLSEIVALPLEPGKRITAAQLALRAGDVEMARGQANLVASSKEMRPAALKLLANIAGGRNSSEYKAALNEIETFYANSGKTTEACESALRKLQAIQKTEDPRQELGAIIKKYPDCAPAYAKMAQLVERESASLSLMYLEKTVALDPGDFRSGNRLAHVYIRMQKFDKAEEVYNRFLDSHDSSIAAYIELAKCKQAQNENNEAIRVLQDGGMKNENSQALWLELANAYQKAGQLDLAKKEYEHVVQIDSESSYAQKALSSLNKND